MQQNDFPKAGSLYKNGSAHLDPLDRWGASKCSREFVECEASRYIWIIISPLLLLFGTVGNILTMIMMLKKPYRDTAFGTYLLFIAFADTIGIWTDLIRTFIQSAFLYDIRNHSPAMCQTQMYVLYSNIDSSVWLLTAVSVERMFSVFWPTKARFLKDIKKTRIIIALIFFVQYSWNLHVFFTRGKEVIKVENGTGTINNCGYPSKEYKDYWYRYHYSITALVVYSLLPFLVMLMMNISIFWKLRHRDKKCENMVSIHKTGVVKILAAKLHADLAKTQVSNNPKGKGVSQKTLMLLPVTVFFLVATSIPLIFAGIREALILNNLTDHEKAKLEFAGTSVLWLTYLNHSVNFYLYCLTGSVFRKRCQELLANSYRTLFMKCKQKKSDKSAFLSRSAVLLKSLVRRKKK